MMSIPHKSWHPTDSVISEVDRKHLAIVGEYLEGPPQLIKQQRPEKDPDYDNINNIYSRLPTKSPSPRHQKDIHFSCECHRVAHSTLGKGKHRQRKNKESSEEESDEEDEDVDISVLLKMLDGLSKRPDGRISCAAFRGVLEGFTSPEALSEDQLLRVCGYLDSVSPKIQEMTWSLMSRLCENPDNVKVLLQKDLLKRLTQAIGSSGEGLGPCVDTLINVVRQADLREAWYEEVLSQGVPLLLTALSMEGVALDHKYRIGCFFHVLGKDSDFLGILENRVLPVISEIRDLSAKLKEIYTKILGEVVKNEDSLMTSHVDGDVTGIALSMLQDGPCDQQTEALSLLCILSETDHGRSTVINEEEILPSTLSLIRHSKCRLVSQRALVLMNHVTSTRRLGLCKELMSHLSNGLLPSPHANRQTDKSLVRGRQEREGRLWRGLDSYVELLTKIFCKEAKVEKDGLQKVLRCRYRPDCDIKLMVQCSAAILKVCLWPAHRNKLDLNSLDLTSFTDCPVQRKKYRKINRALVQMVWDSFGEPLFELLSCFSRKLADILDLALKARQGKQLCPEHDAKSSSGLKVLDRLGFVDLYAVFEEKEVDLIVVLLELVLVMSLCSCHAFSDLFPGPVKSRKKLAVVSSKSDPTIQEGVSRPASPVKSRPSSALGLSSLSEEERRQGLKQKEISAERRLLRKCLYEAGVFQIVLPFIQCSHLQCQIFACEIFRANIQSIEEREVTLNSLYGPVNASANAKLRPQSAAAALTRDLRVQQALHTMSPHVAHIIKDALGPRLAPTTPHVIPRAEDDADTEAVTRLSQFVIENRPGSRKADPIPEVPKPVLDPLKPVASQCRDLLLQEGGSKILAPLFSSSMEVRKLSALLLGDLVHCGNVDIHMTLSQLGCMQKLLDFLRTNTSNVLLEIIGLIIVQMMVKSDKRIEQLFNHYGGTRLLMAMVKFTTGDLRKQVISTLKSVTHGTKKTRPSSAPVLRIKKTPDVWDKIQQQWAHQDKVEEVLHQWYR